VILKTQDFVFREIPAAELSFHNDITKPSKEEKNPHTPLKNKIVFH